MKCLINLIAFCNEIGLVGERSAVDIVYLCFSKAFDILLLRIICCAP